MKLAALILATTATASLAHADTSKSWATVKGMLPENVNVIAGANLSTLRATSMYATLMPGLIAKVPDVKSIFDEAKAACAIDLNTAILDATFAIGDDERGIVVAALDKSIDQKKFGQCLEKVVKARTTSSDPAVKVATPKVVIKTTGKITAYGIDDPVAAAATSKTAPNRIYVAWLAPDVAAVATDAGDKPLLEKMLAGKGAKGPITGLLAKASPTSAVWLAATKPQTLPTGGTMKGAFGTIDATKGNVSVDMSLVMGSAKEAKAFVDQATALLASARKGIPKQFVKLVDALQLTSTSETTNVKLTASEKDVLGVLVMAMMNL